MTETNITSKQANILYTTMKFLHDTFINNNIGYWVTGGTLMGAIRHRGIIPWDDDGDICIMLNDVPKLRKLIPFFKKHGYIINDGTEDQDESTQCQPVRNSCSWFVTSTSINALGVDIFIMKKVGPIITYASPYWRTSSNGGKKCYFIYNMVFPLLPVRFGNFWVMSPKNAVEHLNQCYGTDWTSMSQRLYDHREGKWIDSKKIRMRVNSYHTIQAPTKTNTPTAPSIGKMPRYISGTDDLLISELKMIATIYNIQGRSTMSNRQLRNAIHKFI